MLDLHLGFWGVGFRDSRTWGYWFWDVGFRECTVWGLGCGISGRVWGLGFWGLHRIPAVGRVRWLRSSLFYLYTMNTHFFFLSSACFMSFTCEQRLSSHCNG